jgi:hypothetical protein
MARSKHPNYKMLKKENDRDLKFIKEHRRKCECGHAIDFKGYYDYKICTWCGRKVYKDDRAQFKHIMEQRLSKMKQGDNND